MFVTQGVSPVKEGRKLVLARFLKAKIVTKPKITKNVNVRILDNYNY